MFWESLIKFYMDVETLVFISCSFLVRDEINAISNFLVYIG